MSNSSSLSRLRKPASLAKNRVDGEPNYMRLLEPASLKPVHVHWLQIWKPLLTASDLRRSVAIVLIVSQRSLSTAAYAANRGFCVAARWCGLCYINTAPWSNLRYRVLLHSSRPRFVSDSISECPSDLPSECKLPALAAIHIICQTYVSGCNFTSKQLEILVRYLTIGTISKARPNTHVRA